ncbi:MAG: hypothetical protein ACOYN7_09345 [Candidatus Nanopelagicales bacterium]
MNYSSLRNTLKAGSIVFGASALFLIILPETFLGLLGLEVNDGMVWAMRMIGITLIALAGNMWNNSRSSSDAGVGQVAWVMFVSASALGVLTLLIPAQLTWFAYLYAAIGFGFGLSYLINIVRK